MSSVPDVERPLYGVRAAQFSEEDSVPAADTECIQGLLILGVP